MAQQYTTYGTYDNEYGREYNCPTERMYVHASVYLPSSEVDPRTGLLKPDSPRRGRTQAKRMEYAYLDKEYKQLDEALKARQEHRGIRISLRASVLAVAVFAFIFGLMLLSQQGNLAERQKALNRMNKSIEECAKMNGEISAQITEASDITTICYAAARDLNMIPAEASEAIHLVAMDTRPLETATYSTARGNSMGSEGTQGEDDSAFTQATSVPIVASAGAGN